MTLRAKDDWLAASNSGPQMAAALAQEFRDFFKLATPILIGATEQTTGLEKFNITDTELNTSANARPVLAGLYQTVQPSASAITADYHVIDAKATTGSSNAGTVARLYTIEGKAVHAVGSTLLAAVGGLFSVQNAAAGTITSAYGGEFEVRNLSTGTITDAAGVHITAGTNPSGTITTQYGLKIESQNLGGTSYAIHTGVGRVRIQAATAIPANGSNSLGYHFSSSSNFGVTYGSGAPTLIMSKGSLYLRSDGTGTSDRLYVATDSAGTWTAVTTAA